MVCEESEEEDGGGERDALEEERMAVMLWYIGAALQKEGYDPSQRSGLV